MRIPPRTGALIAVVFWGISFVATKAALREIHPTTLIFVRFAVGALLLGAMVRRLPPRDAWPALCVMGFVGIFVHQLLQAFALTMTSATHAGWLIGLTPIWSAIFASATLGERFDRWKAVGLAGGFTGALLVMTRGDLSVATFAVPSTRGDLMIFASTINWALYSVLGHATIRRVGPRVATSASMAAGALMLAPFFVARSGWKELPGLSGVGWLAVAFLSVGCSALGYLFWYGALERVEVSQVAALLYLEPFVTFIAAVVLLGEKVSATAVAGGLLVLASVAAMTYGPRRFRAGTGGAAA